MSLNQDMPDFASISIEDEMQKSYLDYAMSVIVARALPDVRDGLKPVQRRILYAMHDEGYTADRPYRKSARIVGDVMGRYHPHGDSAIYDAMVRLAQAFAMRIPLVDGQGNFGSMDGDPPAAMRYTEARLARVSSSMLDDLANDTVGFRDNYDGSEQEPVVLPSGFPNILVNGSSGIAVGMATSIPPHNPVEVVDACCAMIDDPDIDHFELMNHVQGPDFPTGGQIIGTAGIRQAYLHGHGKVVIRARCHVETLNNDREAIVVTEVPFPANKERMIESIAEIASGKSANPDRIVTEIHELRDESDRHGVRVVLELKRHAMSEVVLNKLFRGTKLQDSFAINMLALDESGMPQVMNLRDILSHFIGFREQVVVRRTRFQIAKMQDRAHLLLGQTVAVSHVGDVVALIRSSADPQQARERLLERQWPVDDHIRKLAVIVEGEITSDQISDDGFFRFSEKQARAILAMQLQRLTGLEREKIAEELRDLAARIADNYEILRSRDRLMRVVRGELVDVRARLASDRRTTIEEGSSDQEDEDLIAPEDMVVTVSRNGYIKRVSLDAHRAQHHGGKGHKGMSTREEDLLQQVLVVNTHAWLLFFTSSGLVYRLKTYRLPSSNTQSRGKHLVNLLALKRGTADGSAEEIDGDAGETVSAILPLPRDESEWAELQLVFVTSRGQVRRNTLTQFGRIRTSGLIAMKLSDGERIVSVETCREEQDVLLFTRRGRCIRFAVTDVRLFKSRASSGVRGARLDGDDEIIGMTILDNVPFDIATRDAYFRRRNSEDSLNADVDMDDETYADLKSREQLLLMITDDGYGKCSSAFEYRRSNRGIRGYSGIKLVRDDGGEKSASVVAAFPVSENDQIVLVTGNGTLIRCPVARIRVAGRATRGVRLFRVGEESRVVSASRIVDGALMDDETDDDAATVTNESRGGERPPRENAQEE